MKTVARCCCAGLPLGPADGNCRPQDLARLGGAVDASPGEKVELRDVGFLMHQFARALRSVLAGGCLVLAVWAVATYFVPFSFARSWGDQHLRVGASAGRISLASHAYLGPDLAAYPPFNRSALLGGFGIDHVRSRTLSIGTSEMIDGFSDARPVRYRYRPGPPPVVVLTRGITLPGWVLCVCFAAYPFVCSTRAARRLREQQRTARGCCRYCGYDLRATPARCPECGQPKPNLAPTLHIGAA